MVKIEELAIAVLAYDTLRARDMIPAFFDPMLSLALVPKPKTENRELLVTSAALLELISLRRGQTPPEWTEEIGSLAQTRYLLKAAESMRRLRSLCENESPEPLRKRGLLAPPNFLEFV